MARPQTKRKADKARLAAVKVIHQVTEEQAFSNESAAFHLASPDLDARDRAFASAILFGTLSRLPYIDYLLTRASSRPLADLDPWIRAILRAGVWQLFFSYQATAAAACDESVRLARFLSGERATGFVNGILRSLAREGQGSAGPHAAILEAGLPLALHDLLAGWYGGETALALGQASLLAPAHAIIRPNGCRLDAFEAWLLTSQAESLRPERAAWPPGAYTMTAGGRSLTATDAYEAGLYSLQSQAAMTAGHVLYGSQEDRYLDLCASPGGKTGHLAELAACKASILACDLSAEKVETLRANLTRLGHTFVQTRIHDAAALEEDMTGSFDRVLCDVPCSGLGLLSKRPEIRSRVTRESIDRLRGIQGRILASGARALAPGGRLLYSTCTINPEENEEQIKDFLASEAGASFELEDLTGELLSLLGDSVHRPFSDRLPGTILFLPHLHDTDGFFLARLRRMA